MSHCSIHVIHVIFYQIHTLNLFLNLFSDSSFWIQHTNIQHSDKYKRQLYMCWTEYINETTKTTHTWRNVDCTTEFEYLCTLGTGYNIDN